MPVPRSPDELIQTIQSRYAQLSPQFQAAARYLIDHPAQVSTLSARKLSLLAGVQPATLVRLAQHLGYVGWDALKSVFTHELQQHHPSGYTARAQSLVASPQSAQASWAAASQQQSHNLMALEPANRQAFNRVVAHLVQAQRIIIAGFRSSYPAAFSLRYLCSLFRPDIHLLHNAGGTMSLDLQHLQPSDTVVLISYSPYSREIIQVAAAARAQGCTILALCDSQVAPIALQADHVLTFTTQGHSFFPSTVAIQSLVEMLAQQFLVRSGEHAIAELSHTESQLHATGAYV
ncbi:MurR/RpiR family transcriptional regulator [Castellaniella caeni]|uniref:MurR/RpiR family transcriptional regulator n=1 Tax=Castellaniella caeni TaxID=266123 RepID=UPI00082A39C9|nr:MurR/RpiR family transcriptional regulator [Castellaniella caeni]